MWCRIQTRTQHNTHGWSGLINNQLQLIPIIKKETIPFLAQKVDVDQVQAYGKHQSAIYLSKFTAAVQQNPCLIC